MLENYVRVGTARWSVGICTSKVGRVGIPFDHASFQLVSRLIRLA